LHSLFRIAGEKWSALQNVVLRLKNFALDARGGIVRVRDGGK
jgi:hypothetical protein